VTREKFAWVGIEKDNLSHSVPSEVTPLLNASPVFAADGREALAEALSTVYRARAVSLTPPGAPVSGAANRVQLGTVTLHYCQYDAPVRIAFNHMPGYRQFFGLGGSGRVRAGGRQMEIGPVLSGILPPDGDFEAEYGAGYSHLVAQFDPERLERLRQAWEDPGRERLALPVLQTLDAERLARLRRIALCLADQFDRDAPRHVALTAELEQALAIAFLHENGVQFSEKDAPCAAPNEAARLRDYVEAHWAEPLLIEDVAAACGVSVRSVFDRFKRDFEATPAAYLRRVRLQHAHRMLSAGTEGSVLDVALRCGFSSFGHFARRYREAFGELPSHTLERARLR
jgi:AraC-like DNA-binding protein